LAFSLFGSLLNWIGLVSPGFQGQFQEYLYKLVTEINNFCTKLCREIPIPVALAQRTNARNLEGALRWELGSQ